MCHCCFFAVSEIIFEVGQLYH